MKCTMTTHCIVQSRVPIRYHTTICSPGHLHKKRNGWHFPFQVPHFWLQRVPRLQFFFPSSLITINRKGENEKITLTEINDLFEWYHLPFDQMCCSLSKMCLNHFKGPIVKSYTINSETDCTTTQLIWE